MTSGSQIGNYVGLKNFAWVHYQEGKKCREAARDDSNRLLGDCHAALNDVIIKSIE